jgi:MoaA/NifB/PqqE/SkfB family radical SAM enzyme
MKNKLWRITLDTNPEDCNLNCIMCEEHSPYSDFKEQLYKQTGTRHRRMPKEWIANIFEEAYKFGVKEIIPSTMGEPLLYSNIDLFFQLAKKYEIQINLTTNGTFPGKGVEDWAALIIPVTSDTKISLNGSSKDTAEKVMLGLDFDKQVQDINQFVEYRNRHYSETGFYSRITLQLTFMQNNMHELVDIIKLAAELDIDRIKGHHLWTHFDEIKELSFKQNAVSMVAWNAIVDEARTAVNKYRKSNGERVILEQIDYLQEQESAEVPYEYDCPFLEKELWISATGKISPCCAPDEQRNSLGDFGNYPEVKIEDVLSSPKYKDLVKNYKQHPLCKQCVMRKPIEK